MCLIIVPKDDLTKAQLTYIDELIDSPEHKDDSGPPKVWHTYQQGLYAVVKGASNIPIGLVEASGPLEAVTPGWWLDSQVREKGYGHKMVDALAKYLKDHGVTGVGNIPIQSKDGVYDKASIALAISYKAHFKDEPSS